MNRCFLVTLSCVPRDDVEEVLDRLAQSFEMRRIHRRPNKKFKGTDNMVFFAELRREEQEEAGRMTWYFVCDGCGKKTDAFDENVVDGTGRSLCSCCARSLLEKERFFMSHVPGCVDAEHHMIRYTTWADLGAKVRHRGRIGCEYEDATYVTLVDVFESDGKVHWWVLGYAHNGPENPPWPYWKEIVRELGGSA